MSGYISYVCPFCGRSTSIDYSHYSSDRFDFDHGNYLGSLRLKSSIYVCPHKGCNRFSLHASLHKLEEADRGGSKAGEQLNSWKLIPQSQAKPFPDYVPKPIREDYEEACKIQFLSPKASATLSRRCLQGILRDYWKMKPGRLVDEIAEIETKVHPDTWQVIDDVRSVGNIGAHMERDVNIVIDVDPEEAGLLIGLIEELIEDWYIEDHKRKEKKAKITAMAASKKAAKQKPAP
jgi:hypothetical protein